MSSINCKYSQRDKRECYYNVDCNNFNKSNQIRYVCPIDTDIKHSVSNLNKVLICNLDSDVEYSKNLYQRNLPEKNIKVNYPYRGKYRICNKDYIDLKIKEDEKKQMNNFIPGKIPIEYYFDNIDKESDLFLINRDSSFCNQYRPQKYITSIDQPDNILHNFNKDVYKECNLYSTNIHRDQNENTNQKNSDLKFNYVNLRDQCGRIYLPRTECSFNNPNLIADQLDSYKNMDNDNMLKVGPIRRDHSIENLWHNNSKRDLLI